MLANELERHLREKILPFWEKLADEEHGGFYGWVDKDLLVNPKAHKGCILNSRILWTFATATRILGDGHYLPFAQRAYDFLQRFWDEPNGGVYWSVTHDGRPLDTTKHTYCQAFAIYGLAAYARATGLQEPLEKAMRLFDVIEEKCTDAGGYGEAFMADFSPQSNEKLSENGVMASRTMNTLIHVLEAYAELYRAGGSERVRCAGAACLETLLHKVYHPGKQRLEVFFDAQYVSLLNMQSFGHDIEASWLMWDAVQCLLPPAKHQPFRQMCIALAESVHRLAMTDHGLRNETVDGVMDEVRVWWVQAEALLGFHNAFELTGDGRFQQDALMQWDVIKRMIVDPRPNGEWYWSVHEDGAPTGRPIVEEWKCPYHNSRMCLRMIEQLK